jgi:hypothetical protein
MALHREYIAFLPWDQQSPAGPLDEPVPPELPPGLEGYWEENARTCFQAARAFNDLMWTCKEERALVETPIVGFAMFYVVQIRMSPRKTGSTDAADIYPVIWCRFFAHQDQHNLLCTHGTSHDTELSENSYKAYSILVHMHERLPMARMWCLDSKEYLEKLKELRKLRQGTGESPISNSSTSTDGSNQGLMHWKSIEKKMTEFSRIYDADLEADDNLSTNLQQLDHASEPDSPQVIKSEKEDKNNRTPAPRPGSFVAINAEAKPLNGDGPPNGKPSKPVDTYIATPLPRECPAPFQVAVHHRGVEPSSNGSPLFQPPSVYHPPGSKEPDNFNQPTYNPVAPPISPYNNVQHPIPLYDESYAEVLCWPTAHYSLQFAAGNSGNTYETMPLNTYHGFQGNYDETENNSMT